MIEEGSPGLIANAVGDSTSATSSLVIDPEIAEVRATREELDELQLAITARQMQSTNAEK
jgi:hypothetical protein